MKDSLSALRLEPKSDFKGVSEPLSFFENRIEAIIALNHRLFNEKEAAF